MTISKSRSGVALAALLLTANAHALGPITFSSQTPAVIASPPKGASASTEVSRTAGQQRVEQQPGVSRAIFSPVTSEESERAISGRTLPRVLNPGVVAKPLAAKAATSGGSGASTSAQRVAGDAAPSAPASIPELARALRGNPDLIYEYVRNNIEYVPMWGIQKGAVGTILDNQGTAFDQATLMVELLRQSGYTAGFVKGRINLTAAQVGDWLGVDTTNVCAVANLFSNGQTPIGGITATAAGACPGSTAALHSIRIDHVWVKVNIGGTNYVFDPSFKTHTKKTGIDLVTATGYNASSYLTAALSGATVNANYVQNVHRTNIRNNLTTYASNLASYIRTNKSAGTLEDVIGGMTINPHTDGTLRQASLPYQDTTVGVTEWATDIPAVYKPTLRVQYQGIDATYTADAIYGKRLSITYNGSSQPVLMLDGAVAATGTAVTAGTYGNVNFTVTHGAYAQTFANQAFAQQIKAGGTFVISNSWGPTGRGTGALHRTRLEEARAAGAADTSELALGSSLSALASNWIAQTNQTAYIHDRLARTTTLFHHQVGIAGYNTSPFVDLPGNKVGVISQDANTAKESANFFSSSSHFSILESTAVQQTSGVSAVSTVKLIDMAVGAGQKIFSALPTNYASQVRDNLVGCANWISTFNVAIIDNGRRLILPESCSLTEGSWTGTGFYSIDTAGTNIGSIIGGGLAGGFSSSPISPSALNTIATKASQTFKDVTQYLGSSFGDPIDMTKGGFLYANDDIQTGVGEFPYSLKLNRLYSSTARLQSKGLGKGWTHNLAASVTTSTDGLQSLGEDSALDAVGSIAESLVSLDLMNDAAKPIEKMVVATIGQRWFGEQLVDNSVIVTQGLNGEVFVKLPDGSYNAPPANSAKLIRNGDATFSYETAKKAKLNFNAAGKATTFTHPSGVQANFTYSGNDLSQVTNSLGRTLTLTTVSGQITNVSDGSRSVQYAYDASGNLTTFTDATSKATTFQYDLPGRITKFFNPSNPTVAAATNVYDTLGRVQTQTNAHGKVYNYYFAGTRSEEVGPLSLSRVSYLNPHGGILKSISPTGKVTLNTYDGQTRLVKTVFPEGNSLEYEYDDAPCSAQLRCTHNPKTIRNVAKPSSGLANITRSFTYESSFNQVATSSDGLGKVTSFAYTAQGLPLTVTSPADASAVQPVTTYGYTAYTAAGFATPFYLPTSVTQKTSASNNVVTTTTYNAANKYVPQTVIVDSGTGKLNLTTTLTFDAVGNATGVNGPRTDVSDTVANVFDAERRLTQSTDALSKLSRNAYDADGRLVRSAAQIGTQWLVSCRSYTVSGKLLKSWGPAETAADTTCPTAAAPVPVVDYTYDDLDRQTRVSESLTTAEGGNRVTDTVYNLDDTVASVQRAVGSAIAQTYATYTYTNNGQVATLKDAKNNLTSYQYDGHDRKLKTFYPDPTAVNTASTTDYEQFGFDANGNLTSLRKRDAQSITLVYDNLNRLTRRVYPVAADTINFTYDLLGRRLSAGTTNLHDNVRYTYDNVGRMTSSKLGNSGTAGIDKTLTYEYDAAGNRVRTTWPEATPFFVTTTYDALNRPTVISELGSTSLASYAYDDLSRRTTVTLGNGTTTTHAYSPQAALSSLVHNLTGTAQDQTYNYTRNQAREITGHTWTNDSYQWAGVTGNVTNGTRSYTANGLNQYTAAAGATLGYDTNGNLTGDGTWTYVYDIHNRLKSAAKSGTEAVNAALYYDGEGRLRKTVINSTQILLTYEGTDLLAEYNGVGALTRRYVHGPGVDEPLVTYEGTTTTNKSWLYKDHLGSVIGTADATGISTAIYSYGPFGELNSTAGQRFRYTGQQQIKELGLYYYKARFYSPTLGRFLQTDPIGTADDLNLYAYTGNNPLNFSDPSGLIAKDARLLGSQIAPGMSKWWDQGTSRLLQGPSMYDFENGINAIPELGLVKGISLGVAGLVSGGKAANALGKAGESAVKAVNDIGEKSAFAINGRNRIADGMNGVLGTITEVKNVGYQHLSTQIKDYVDYSQKIGSRFDLYVRESTVLSPQLKEYVNSGLINLGFIKKP